MNDFYKKAYESGIVSKRDFPTYESFVAHEMEAIRRSKLTPEERNELDRPILELLEKNFKEEKIKNERYAFWSKKLLKPSFYIFGISLVFAIHGLHHRKDTVIIISMLGLLLSYVMYFIAAISKDKISDFRKKELEEWKQQKLEYEKRLAEESY